MAKQVGPCYICGGTVSDLTFYKLDGQYYVRQKSFLSRKRVLKGRWRMQHLWKSIKDSCDNLSITDKRTKERSIYNKLTGMARGMLKEGKKEEEIISQLTVSRFPKKASVISVNFNCQKNYKRLQTETMTQVKTLDFSGQSIFCGIDVHKKSWSVCIRDKEREGNAEAQSAL